jgi:ceramide glucosyltransferase
VTLAESAGIGCLVLTSLNLLSLVIATLRLKRRREPIPAPAKAPPVSIVRPLRGVEAFSEATLASGFALDYPAYELVFCVADAGDPILPLVERLIAAHPNVPARVVIGDERVSDNPKLNNCVRGWDAAAHDWVILADSNVLMPRDYVQQMQAAWRPSSGLVCSTPIGSHPDGFFAEVECAFLNTMQARWQYVGEAIGLGFAQGKSMLWFKPFLEAQGGIRALGAEIAEDAAATKLVRRAGKRVHLVDDPFPQPLGPRTLAEIWSRQFRWARLRRVTFPGFFALEILIGGWLPVALAAFAAWGTEHDVLLAVALALTAWYAGEIVLAAAMGWRLTWLTPVCFLVRDVLQPLIWAGAWGAREVVWRGNAMDIRTAKTSSASEPS